MSPSTLNDRKNALEREFFSRQDQAAIDKLRAQNAAKAQRTALKEAAGISNDAVLDAIENAGINAESLAALSLIPLIAVAWADGEMDDGEREAIQKAASESGASESVSHLLEGWLERSPRQESSGLLEGLYRRTQSHSRSSAARNPRCGTN